MNRAINNYNGVKFHQQCFFNDDKCNVHHFIIEYNEIKGGHECIFYSKYSVELFRDFIYAPKEQKMYIYTICNNKMFRGNNARL